MRSKAGLFRLVAAIMFTLTSALSACTDRGPVAPGDDPNFTIVANDDGVLERCNRKVVVFGVDIYAVPGVDDRKLLHAANLMAQYLDNDEDGEVDNPAVAEAMIDRGAFLVMWAKPRDLRRLDPPEGRIGQDLGDEETVPSFVAEGLAGEFDAGLEEVLHLVTHAGYAVAYPDIFGEASGTTIALAMDTARGGHFDEVPSTYPADAWYTYDDSTCDYSCMVTEYHYWALTSLLGAQVHRADVIGGEWRPNTAAKLQAMDPAIHQLLSTPEYALPTTLPDGTYRR